MSDAQGEEGDKVYGIDDDGSGPRVITGVLHARGSGLEVWWDHGGFNTRWPTGHVGLTEARAWAKYGAYVAAGVPDTRRRLG